MDPIALSGTFATLVGLLANFKAERSGAALADFMEWLKEQHQDQVAVRIDSDTRLSQELKVLLAIKHEDLVVKLGSLTEQMAQVANQIDGFSGLATHLAAPSPLSEQALAVVQQLVGSGAEFAQQIAAGMGTRYLLVGAGNELQVSEPRFLNEDIEALASSGHIRIEHTPGGAKKLVPSRLAYEYVRRRGA